MKAELLPEGQIRGLALNGANLVPKEGLDIDYETPTATLRELIQNLLYTINNVDVNGAHRTAACNLLCTVVERCAQSPLGSFRDLVWSSGTWMRAFEILLNQHHAMNPKPARQLLVTLCSVLKDCADASIATPVKVTVLNRLVSIVCSTIEHVPARPAMQALAHFLTKGLTSNEELYAALLDVHAQDLGDAERSLLTAVLKWAPYDINSSSAGLLASAILDNTTCRGTERQTSAARVLTFQSRRSAVWADPVLKALHTNPDSLDNFRHYIFPEIFRSNAQDYVSFLEHLGLHAVIGGHGGQTDRKSDLGEEELREILFCALSVGSKVGLVQVTESLGDSDQELNLSDKCLCIPDRLLGNLLLRESRIVRTAGLSMLISSTANTRPLSSGTFLALKRGLPYLHADSDAGFRSEMFSMVKQLVDRLRGATASLSRSSAQSRNGRTKPTGKSEQTSVERDASLLKAHHDFIGWYISFLRMELRPSASYQRHISAIKIVSYISRSGIDPSIPQQHRLKSAGPQITWPFNIEVVDADMNDLLLNLLVDPFDDVRQGAAEVLSVIEPSQSLSSADPLSVLQLVPMLEKAEKTMALTGRADHADGVAHLYSIMFSRCHDGHGSSGGWWSSRVGILGHLIEALEKTLDIAAADIGQAVNEHPLHGLFISLRYIFEGPMFLKVTLRDQSIARSIEALFARLYDIVRKVWSCVKDVLCNDAPEGYMPDELEEEEDVGTKDVLSYSWRSLKEVSLLIRSIVKAFPVTNTSTSLVTPARLVELGDQSFTQLAELRHRGAFSTVAQTFTACCIKSNSGIPETSQVVEQWYKRAMLCIRNQTTINTRRSAGLPSLIVGIAVADEAKGLLFPNILRDLYAEATKPVDQEAESAGGLSQVHALNCLKDLFRNSKLGDRSEPHVPEALGLAAECLSSSTWSIRNSGLMLFRALLDRLLGTNDSYVNSDMPPHSRLSFVAIPNLMEVILRLLAPLSGDAGEAATEGVFPALQLLQRAPPPADRLPEVRKAVLRLMASSHWHIRDKAARTFAVLTSHNRRVAQAVRLMKKPGSEQNAVHGALLCARYLIQRNSAALTDDDLQEISVALSDTAMDLYHDNTCQITQAAFVDVFSDWCRACISCKYVRDGNVQVPFLASAGMELMLTLDDDAYAARSALRQSLAEACIVQDAFLRSSNVFSGNFIKALTDMAPRDGDAVSIALNEGAKLCTNARFAMPVRTLIGKVSLDLLCDAGHRSKVVSDLVSPIGVEVQAAAQNALLAVLDSEAGPDTRTFLQTMTDLRFLPTKLATPLFQDTRLVLQGALLEMRCSYPELSDEKFTQSSKELLVEDCKEWLQLLVLALHEDNTYDTRWAAAQAAAVFQPGLEHMIAKDEFQEVIAGICLAVYDLCNDDDDDIRKSAAVTACRILRMDSRAADFQDTIPLSASSLLAQFLVQRFSTSDMLVQEAITRLTAGTNRSIGDRLVKLGEMDTSLFIQEKQNLFLDEARESRLWSQVLLKLSPQTVWADAQRTEGLLRWVSEGVEALTAHVKSTVDGLLGWSRQGEGFILGLRAIYAAEVLIRGGADAACVRKEGAKLRRQVLALLVVGKDRNMNPLWVRELERVVCDFIARDVAGIMAQGQGVEGGAVDADGELVGLVRATRDWLQRGGVQ